MGIFILRGGELFTRPRGEHISTLTKLERNSHLLVLVFITALGVDTSKNETLQYFNSTVNSTLLHYYHMNFVVNIYF